MLFFVGIYVGGEVVGVEILVRLVGGQYVLNDDDQFVGDGDDCFFVGSGIVEVIEFVDLVVVVFVQVVIGVYGGLCVFDQDWLQVLVVCVVGIVMVFVG